MKIKSSIVNTLILVAMASIVAALLAGLSTGPMHKTLPPDRVFMVMFILIVGGSSFALLRPFIRNGEQKDESNVTAERRG